MCSREAKCTKAIAALNEAELVASLNMEMTCTEALNTYEATCSEKCKPLLENAINACGTVCVLATYLCTYIAY